MSYMKNVAMDMMEEGLWPEDNEPQFIDEEQDVGQFLQDEELNRQQVERGRPKKQPVKQDKEDACSF